MPKLVSGKKAVKILCRKFGFSFVSQKGSHVKLARRTTEGKIITIVPMHRELARGTLNSILELAHVAEDEFWSEV